MLLEIALNQLLHFYSISQHHEPLSLLDAVSVVGLPLRYRLVIFFGAFMCLYILFL